jgi:hypothetical protein
MNGEAVAFWRRLGTTPGWAERYVGCQGRLGQMETGPRQEKKKREPVLDWVKLILGLESKKKEYALQDSIFLILVQSLSSNQIGLNIFKPNLN